MVASSKRQRPFTMLLFSLLALLVLACSANQDTFSASSSSIPRSSLSLTSISRTVELGGATSKATTVYSLKPFSSSSSSDDGEVFVFAVDARDAANLSWIEAYTGRTGNTKKPVKVKALNQRVGDEAQLYAATIPSTSVKPDEETHLSVYTNYNHLTTPKPATLPQEAANQGMHWERDLVGGQIVNPSDELASGSVTVRIKCPTPRAAEDMVPPGWSATHTPGSAIIQFMNTQGLGATSGSQIASIHYEQPEPVLSVRKLDRTVQISHWGNHVAIEDEILLVNDGPKLKGHFSRLSHQALSYQRRGAAFVTPHTANNIVYSLPGNVYSPYFIDEIGNVSTSRFRPAPRQSSTVKLNKSQNLAKSHLQLTPRYPLLGGWNYSFSVGYKQPLTDILKYDSKKGEYKLAIPFLTDLKNAAFDNVTVRFVLPEGAHDVTISYPFEVETSTTNKTYGYLDTSGRPTVTLHRSACGENHAQDVILSYKFTTLDLIQKPAAVATFALSAFFILGLSRKISWSIKGENLRTGRIALE